MNTDNPPSVAPDDSRPARRPVSAVDRVLALLGSFNIAIVLFMLIIIVTFAGTWLQGSHGLYDCQKWYFDSWVTPRDGWLWGWLPLPGMALLLAILFVNVLAGGVIRIRKSPRTIGVIIAHLSMLGFIIAGAVSLWSKTEGFLIVNEKGKNNLVQANNDWVIEVREITNADGTSPADKRVHFIPDKFWRDCEGEKTRTFFKSGWPFEVKVGGYVRNARVVPVSDPGVKADSTRSGEFGLVALKVNVKNEEANFAGVRVELLTAGGGAPMESLLSASSTRPWVVTVDNRRYALAVARDRWELPFSIQLDDFRAKYYPGTRKAESYESDIRVLHEGGKESKHYISMNNPLRDSGYVAYQTNYDQDSPPGKERYSVFTVVKNRSDQWPLYSLLVCTAGLVLHFVIKLAHFLKRSSAVATTTPTP